MKLAILILISGLLVLLLFMQACKNKGKSIRSCPANLDMIQGAKLEWARERNKDKEDTPPIEDLVGPTNYLQSWPQCPKGGIYTMGKVKEMPRCSITSHVFSVKLHFEQ